MSNLISVVIPAYNEVDNIFHTIDSVIYAMGRAGVDRYEILIVDDHSTTYEMFDKVKTLNDSRVKIIRLSSNSGSHIAIRAGLQHATGDAIAVLSADGQDVPDTVCAMIDQWKNGAQIVWALRRKREEAWAYKLMALLFYRILTFFDRKHKMHDFDISRVDFYLLDRRVANAINLCTERKTSLFGLLLCSGFREACVEYDRPKRSIGTSKWVFRSRLQLTKDWIFSFSSLPLKLASMCGFALAISGFLFAVYIIINAILGEPIEGWSSLMVAITTIGGLNMVLTGIVGEYLWLNIVESKQRPLYFVEDSNFPRDLPDQSRQNSATESSTASTTN